MALNRKFIFVVNPGSASRKYAAFLGLEKIATVHFELVDNLVVGTIQHLKSCYKVQYDDGNLANTTHRILPLLRKYGIMNRDDEVSAIGIRVVAPGKRFTEDHLVTPGIEKELDELHTETPLHIRTALSEIRQLKKRFPKVPIIQISDSRFHKTKPDVAKYYAIDLKLADKYGIERYGFHGISVESVVKKLQQKDMLLSKLVVCHLGSGNSVTAVLNGKSVDNTMGFSPLEGLMMSTRSGSIDVSAAVAIKDVLDLTDIKVEQYLDCQAGLLGVSGSSDDIRQLVVKESRGDVRAKLALDMYAYKVAQAVAQMSVAMDGMSCLAFTGTVGERSSITRERIVKQLGFLNLIINEQLNNKTYEPTEVTNIATSISRPILVVSTDESVEIAKRTRDFVKKPN